MFSFEKSIDCNKVGPKKLCVVLVTLSKKDRVGRKVQSLFLN